MAILLLAPEDCSLGPVIGGWRCKAYTVKAGDTASATIQSDFSETEEGNETEDFELPSRSNMLYVTW